jgi:hypothetical protein
MYPFLSCVILDITSLKEVFFLPYTNFIPVKRMIGHLIISQKRNHWASTLTTKELIFQKPHLSYHILLNDVIGIIPCEMKGLHPQPDHDLLITLKNPSRYYKISVHKLFVINRNGVFTNGATDLIVPLNHRFLKHVEKYTNLTMLPS